MSKLAGLFRIGTHTDEGVQIVFDSYADFVTAGARSATKRRRERIVKESEWFGADNLDHAVSMARAGLPRAGIEALRVSDDMKDRFDAAAGDTYVETYGTAGSFVDMGRYVTGEPECMIDYELIPSDTAQRIVTIACNIAVLGHVSADAIEKRGQATVAAIEAIETTGRQVEVWADMTSRCRDGSNRVVRLSVLIKRAGEAFDVGRFMFAMTSPAMFRVFGLTAREGEACPKSFRDGLNGGRTETGVWRLSDYPPGTVYMKAIQPNDDPVEHAKRVLKETGLAVNR